MHLKDANSMAVSVERPWHWEGHSLLFCLNELRNKPSHLVGPPFQILKVSFSATLGWQFPKVLIKRSLANWWV